MFRATSCSSSGESIVSIQHLVYVTLCQWLFRVQVRDLHTKQSPTQSDIYQMLYWHNWFSWWWARGCSKHVEDWNKYIENNCASSWSFTKSHNKLHGQQNIIFFKRSLFSVSPRTFNKTRFLNFVPYLIFWTEHTIQKPDVSTLR